MITKDLVASLIDAEMFEAANLILKQEREIEELRGNLAADADIGTDIGMQNYLYRQKLQGAITTLREACEALEFCLDWGDTKEVTLTCERALAATEEFRND